MDRGKADRSAGNGYDHVYWDAIINQALEGPRLRAWRAYQQCVYQSLIEKWQPEAAPGSLAFKTDLFEEAVNEHYLLDTLKDVPVGMDYSASVARAARARLQSQNPSVRDAGAKPALILAGDLRHLPLRDGAMTFILSGSSLDHFRDKEDIAVSLRELARVLAPGGTLILTLDNPHNFVVWVRNSLPFHWLSRLRLVPYYVGATYTRREARRQLEAAGLIVTDETAVAHAPRAPAIWMIVLLERLGLERLATKRLSGKAVSQRITRLLLGFEVLRGFPARYQTGYYIALRACKPQGGEKVP